MARDFIEELKKQISFLKTSCDLYDRGDEYEAIRIATVLRTLLHDSIHSKSLFSRLKINYLLSSVPKIVVAPGQSTIIGLIVLVPQVTPEKLIGKCIPSCLKERYTEKFPPLPKENRKEKNILIQDWWNEQLVFYWKDMRITRKKLVRMAADQDGGAHVDDILEPEYEALLSGEDLKIEIKLTNGKELECSFKNAHLAGLRQLGYEILKSPEVMNLIN